jgi:hypothetical protein
LACEQDYRVTYSTVDEVLGGLGADHGRTGEEESDNEPTHFELEFRKKIDLEDWKEN